MKKPFLIFLMMNIHLCIQAQKPDLLSNRFSQQELLSLLIPQSEWTPFPKINDRDGWAKADQVKMQFINGKAESYIDYKWPYIPATHSLLIERTGDRDEYQNVSFKKREVLGTLLIAEIYENKGRFIDPIINGVWSICEESFWGVPAHLPKSKEFSGLVDISDPFVDLFVAETATILALVDYFLGDRLDKVSPQIRKRIYYETNSRMFGPLMNKHHFFMRTDVNGRRPNNWNPWICSNWLMAILLIEKDDEKRSESVFRILNVLDQFLNPYPYDGGCDEGPSYWVAAAASLYDNISILNLASNNAFKYVFENEKIKNMARYIYRVQISEQYFLNFADADPRPKMPGSLIYRYGKDINDEEMMKFGAFYSKPMDTELEKFHFFRNFFSMFIQDELKLMPQSLPLPLDMWLPDIEVMIARDRKGSDSGFFVAAKGGHNDESHNHNDIGNYIVYFDGQPVIIDIGRGTYTQRTFSPQRYDIWYHRSDYHNLPTVNGKTQLPGNSYMASDVKYSKGNSYAQLELDISRSYPEDTGIKKWIRTIRLNRGKNVLIQDNSELNEVKTVTQHMITCYPAEVVKAGEVVIRYKSLEGIAKDFIIKYNPTKLKATVEKINLVEMEDKGVLAKWGDNIHRINFLDMEPKGTNMYLFEIKMP